MNLSRFETIFNEQVNRCKDLLITKCKEYASNEDRLSNFRKGAALQGISEAECLFGYLSKHLVSIAEMCKDDKSHDLDKWNEKITDAMNYLFLLRALVEENKDKLVVKPIPVNDVLIK